MVFGRTVGESPPIIGDLVPRAEVSKQLGVSEQTLRLWELSGEGPPTLRIGRRVFYRIEVVRRWLLDQERRTPTD
jgi:DNA-binding transcriptional MerR regulator